jgi:transposase-like protein
MIPEIKKIQCPNCASKNTKKAGVKHLQLQIHQNYLCKDCNKTFKLNQHQVNKTYPITTILKTISFYNLGHPQSKISSLLRTNPKPSQKTISNWIKEYKHLTPYNKLRTEAIKQYSPEELIQQHNFLHNNLNYQYQLHNYKLNTLTDEKYQKKNFSQTFPKSLIPLKDYLNKIPTKDFPHHIFQPNPSIEHNHNRASTSNFKTLNITQNKKQNLANKLADIALNLAKNNKQRHEVIQDFMITNDTSTIATEIPIYLTKDDLIYFQKQNFNITPEQFNTPITGHIDFLQIRNNNIHILDYKPDTNKEHPINQLTIYALALASRTKLPLTSFKCAYFDNNNYYEFFPLHCVYKKQNKIEKFK